MINVTSGTDIQLVVSLRREGRPFPVELSDGVQVNMVSARGQRKSVSYRVGGGKLLVSLVYENFGIGVWGLEVTGRLAEENWRGFWSKVVKYTYETEEGARRVVSSGDGFDVTLDVGVMSEIVPTMLRELGEDSQHRTVTDDEKERWNNGGGKIDVVKVNGEPLPIDEEDRSVDIPIPEAPEPDTITTEIFGEKLQANAILDVDALPVDNIHKKSIYRLAETIYWYKGLKIDKPVGYAITELGTTNGWTLHHLLGDVNVKTGKMIMWGNKAGIDELISQGNFEVLDESDADYENKVIFYLINGYRYDYKSTISTTVAHTLYHNPTGDNGTWKQIGGKEEPSDVDFQKEITYAELKSLRDNGELVAGMRYRITDFVTTTAQSDTRSAGHPFDIIVTADDEQTLNENARAIQHEGDTYFASCNLAAWELKYCLDNDKTKYAWADVQNGKGVIYWMKDEKENECPYDFKNVQFKRWAVTDVTSTRLTAEALNALKQTYVYNAQTQPNRFANQSSNISVQGTTLMVDANNSDYYYTFSNYGVDASINSNGVNRNVMWSCRISNKLSLPKNVFFGDNYYDNTFWNDCLLNTFGNNCRFNTLGNRCSHNIFGNNCNQNTFGNNCYNNIFGSSCDSNTLKNYCSQNIFMTNCLYNVIENYCTSNTFGNRCNYNIFGNYCFSNTFGNDCISNTFGQQVNNVATTKNVRYCEFANGVQYVDITTEQPTSSSQYLQNIEVRGVSGTSNSRKVINHPTVGDAFVTTYQPAGSMTVEV